jgi:predicted methyltransferase
MRRRPAGPSGEATDTGAEIAGRSRWSRSPTIRLGGIRDYAALLAAADRSDADREADKRRNPIPFLAFADLRPGMKVLDMGAGGGYSTELIARAVAPGGVVYGQNPVDLPEKPKAIFEVRLKTPAMKDVVADIRPFDDPVPPDLHDLDLITFQFLYHDTTYMNVDRVEMNRKLFAVLKPGGFLLIADHSALPGQGTSVGKPCTASRKARCDKKSKRPASILSCLEHEIVDLLGRLVTGIVMCVSAGLRQKFPSAGALPRRQTRVLTWPIVTVFGFVAQPKQHFYLKPNVTRRAFEAYGPPFDYRPRPNADTYAKLLSLARKVKRDLASLRPRDMIDIQSFLWIQGSDEYPD